MFYIDTRFRSWLKRDVVIGHIVPTLVVFIAFIVLTVLSSIAAIDDVSEKQRQALNSGIEEKKSAIERRLSTYEDFLRSAKGLFTASDKVTRGEWKQFVDSFELSKRYGGIQAVGYAPVVSGNKLSSHIDAVRKDGLKTYSVKPSGSRPLHVNVLYLEAIDPQGSKWKETIGYDIYTDKVRREAMNTARDTGEAAITDIARPLYENPDDTDSVLIMYVPIYSGGIMPSSVPERQAKLNGYVYSVFFTENLLGSDQGMNDSNFGYEIFDSEVKDTSLLYRSANYNSINSSSKKISASETIIIQNQKWQILGNLGPEAIPKRERARPASILWGGALFSIFVAGFIYLLLLNKTRSSYDEEQSEIREAKDELLALASHQLRTPATGVKQYIGLLRDGYAGPLSREQKKYVNKAYENNERQLATINKMLFVARANAKKIDLKLEKFDVKDLLKSVVEDLRGLIKENEQQLQVNLPTNKTYIVADNKYLRMAIENILNNAAKYTPNNGQINLTLKRTKHSIVIKIADTGVGVDAKDHPLLFRKFSRIPNELTNKVSGSGIGLSLVKKVVEAHGGNVNFESERGEGTTFTITLPAKSPK